MTDPLPSWAAGPARTAILAFVAAVTTPGGADFLPVTERIAVFDHDGTLWCEQPMQVQVLFALERATAMAKADPSLKERPAFRAILAKDMQALAGLGKQALFEFALAIHAGMAVQAFQEIVRHWLARSHHPSTGQSFLDMVYQPQIELLAWLQANGFKCFIVSGGGIDFMRVFAEAVYGIPPEQVIGSSMRTKVIVDDGHSQLIKLAELDSFDDRDTKVQNIGLHIGRRPVLAFGNSDGDQAMMSYCLSGGGRRLALLLHHDDGEREFAYDRDFRLSPLASALDQAEELNFQVVSMKADWRKIFAFADTATQTPIARKA
jgi:phosphoglycolate phosphatase-like HAD superfamily hydrolase